MELTSNQSTFLIKLWRNNPNLLPQKESVFFTLVTWLHGPLTVGVAYWCYYETSPDWLRLALLGWLWFVVVLAGLNLILSGIKVAAALNPASLEDRKKYDLEFLSYKMIISIDITPLQLYYTILSATLVGLLLFTGVYALAICMILLKCAGEWYRGAIKKYVNLRLEEISGNLYVY